MGTNTGVEYVKHLRPDLPTSPATMANGSQVPGNILIGTKGMPMVHLVGKNKESILPLGWLIDRFCRLDEDWTKLISPKGT